MIGIAEIQELQEQSSHTESDDRNHTDAANPALDVMLTPFRLVSAPFAVASALLGVIKSIS